MKWYALLLLLPFTAKAQINPDWIVKDNLVYGKLENSSEGMFGFEKAGKYGYLDKTGKVAIEPNLEYEGPNAKYIPSFIKGYALFKKGGKTGMIDKTGTVVLPAEYNSIFYSSANKLVTVAKYESYNWQYGLVNLQNKVIVPLMYDNVVNDSAVFVVKKGSKFGVLDMNGKEVLPIEYTYIATAAREKIMVLKKDNVYIVTDLKGTKIFEKPSNIFTLYTPSQGLIRCMVSSKQGFLDYKGEEVITTKYDNAYDFNSVGLASVSKKNSTSSYSSSYGFIDKRGNEVIPVKYDNFASFQNGYVMLKDPETNRYGYMDKTGKWAIAPKFIDANGFTAEGFAQVKMTDGKVHLINTSGKDLGIMNPNATSFASYYDGYSLQKVDDAPYVLLDKNGKSLKTLSDCAGVYNFSEGIAGYKSTATSLYGFVDLQGNIVAPAAYTGFTGFIEGVSRVSKTIDGKTKYGYISPKGDVVVPIEHDDLTVLRNGWGVVKKNGSYFFINKNGEMKEPARKYDLLQEFRSGFAFGKVNGTNGAPATFYYINTSLKEAFSLQAPEAWPVWDEVALTRNDSELKLINLKGETFKSLTGINQVKFSTDGLMGMRKETGKWGFIDNKGVEITPAIYDSVDSYKNGYAKVKLGTKWGIIDKAGKEVIPTKYENVIVGDNGLFIYLDSWWGMMDKNNKILIAPAYFSLTAFEKDKALGKVGPSYAIVKAPR